MNKLIDYLDADNQKHPRKPRVISSYSSYLNKALKILEINKETFFKISNPKCLIKLKDKLLLKPVYKKLPKSSKEHLRSIIGMYIRYTENLRSIENKANEYVEELILSYYNLLEKSSDKKKAKKSLRKNLSFFDNSSSTEIKFTKALAKYIGIKDENEFKILIKVYRSFQKGKYFQIVAAHPKLAAKLIAIRSHVKVLKTQIK